MGLAVDEPRSAIARAATCMRMAWRRRIGDRIRRLPAADPELATPDRAWWRYRRPGVAGPGGRHWAPGRYGSNHHRCHPWLRRGCERRHREWRRIAAAGRHIAGTKP